jgi:hypothetical protein
MVMPTKYFCDVVVVGSGAQTDMGFEVEDQWWWSTISGLGCTTLSKATIGIKEGMAPSILSQDIGRYRGKLE